MEYLERDGVRLAYTDTRSGQPAVVLLHGMACLHEHMQPLVDVLSPSYRCVALNLRGHGQSSVPDGPFTMDAFTADLAFAIDQLDLDRPVLIGHSFGGSISLAFASAHPERVRSLVMLDSGLRAVETVGEDLNPFYDALRAADDEGYARVVREFVLTRLFDAVDDRVVAAEVADVMAAVPRHVFLSMANTVTSFHSANAALACTVPSMIVQSRQSFTDPVVLAQLASNWHIAQVVGAGHFLQLLVPEQVNAMVLRFLEMTAEQAVEQSADRSARGSELTDRPRATR